MLKIDNNEIYITRGDSGIVELALEKDGEPYDYSEDTVVFSVKRRPCDLNPVIQKEVVNGRITITPDDTDSLPFGMYFYDIKVNTAGGDIVTAIVPTNFTVGEEVHKK